MKTCLAAVAGTLALAALFRPVQASLVPPAAPAQAESARVAPVPGAAPATDLVAEVRANFTPEARRYARTRQALAFLSPLYALGVAALLLFAGISARLRNAAAGLSDRRYLQAMIFVALLLGAEFVLDFPLSWYQGFALEHQFGFSNQSFAQWLGDEAKGLMVGVVFLGAVPLVYLAYLALRKSPRRWWLWLSAGLLPVMILAVLIDPILIQPLFNRFTPLQDEALRQEIVALAERAGIPGRSVYQVDKSRQTRKLNAYVNGFGVSQRIVLWDTTLERMRKDEILAVMGHEMGHYRLRHIWKGILLDWVVYSLVFFVAYRVMRGLVARHGRRWGFQEVSDLASLPLVTAVVGLMLFLIQPATNGLSRAIEHEADVFSLEVTQLNEGLARAFVKLGEDNKSDPEPHPFVKLWLYTHPPLVERVSFALAYRPWERGERPRFYRGR